MTKNGQYGGVNSERQFPGSKGYDELEIYEIHPEEDPQWIKWVSIDGKQVDLGDKECVALWKTGQKVHCLFRIPDIGESDDDQVFWATWSLQTADNQEKISEISDTLTQSLFTLQSKDAFCSSINGF